MRPSANAGIGERVTAGRERVCHSTGGRDEKVRRLELERAFGVACLGDDAERRPPLDADRPTRR
jgi:hypothetical protein